MGLRHRRYWVVIVAIATAIIVSVVAGTFLLRGQPNPCQAVGELVEFNESQMAQLQSRTHVPAAGSHDEPSAPSDADYQAWADGLQQHAAEVTAPDLKEHARRVAALADRAVVVIGEIRSESSSQDALDLEPPPSVKKYGEVTSELQTELQELKNSCPRE